MAAVTVVVAAPRRGLFDTACGQFDGCRIRPRIPAIGGFSSELARDILRSTFGGRYYVIAFGPDGLLPGHLVTPNQNVARKRV